MNVKDLKKAIENLPDDMEVIMQKDSEGNGYSPLSNVNSDAVYIPETTWFGEVFFLNETDEDEDNEMDESELEELNNHKRSLILIPVN